MQQGQKHPGARAFAATAHAFISVGMHRSRTSAPTQQTYMTYSVPTASTAAFQERAGGIKPQAKSWATLFPGKVSTVSSEKNTHTHFLLGCSSCHSDITPTSASTYRSPSQEHTGPAHAQVHGPRPGSGRARMHRFQIVLMSSAY